MSTECGFDLDMFDDKKKAEEYLCAICLDVMNNPYEIGCNQQHMYCKVCLDDLIDASYNNKIKCPQCAQENIQSSSIRQAKYSNRMIISLKVTCDHKDCNETNITLSNLSHHKTSHTFIKCPQKCGENVLKKNIKNHYKTCHMSIFFHTNLNTLINKLKSDFENGKIIRKYFEKYYKDRTLSQMCVLFTDSNKIIHIALTHEPPFRRIIYVGGKYVEIWKIGINVGDFTKGAILNERQFSWLVKGLIEDFIIENGKSLKDAKNELEKLLGGTYFIGRNVHQSCVMRAILGHSCIYKIGGDTYLVTRIG